MELGQHNISVGLNENYLFFLILRKGKKKDVKIKAKILNIYIVRFFSLFLPELTCSCVDLNCLCQNIPCKRFAKKCFERIKYTEVSRPFKTYILKLVSQFYSANAKICFQNWFSFSEKKWMNLNLTYVRSLLCN